MCCARLAWHMHVQGHSLFWKAHPAVQLIMHECAELETVLVGRHVTLDFMITGADGMCASCNSASSMHAAA
jgi:hypothetical protein